MEPIRFLSTADMQKIHDTAKRVLERTGMEVESPQARDYLRKAGCQVDHDTRRVRFPESVVEHSVATMRRQYADPHRLAKRMSVRYSQIRFCSQKLSVHPDFSLNTGGFCVFTTGLDGRKHAATLADARASIRLADALPQITYLGLPCAAQDIPVDMRPVMMAAELAKATDKLGGIEVFNLRDLDWVTRIAEIVAGGKEELRRQPVLIGYGEARTPLCLDQVMSDIFIEYIRRGLPQSLDTMPCTGTTAPGTLAGTLALGCAETLAGLCLGYAVDPDACLAVDFTPSFADSRTMAFSYGSIFRQRWIACRVQMISEFYGCPSGVHGSKTDSCHSDIQAGAEKAMSMVFPVLAGAIGIGTAGHVENALTFSPLQLVIDAQIAEGLRRILRDVEVNDDTLAAEVIDRIGPGGNFLMDDHTLDHLPRETVSSELFNCLSWDTAHGPDHVSIVEQTRAKAAKLMGQPARSVLSASQVAAIDQIVRDAAGQLGHTEISRRYPNL